MTVPPPTLRSTALCADLLQSIDAHPQRRITFADYMELVLYHPLYGYYTSQGDRLGYQGDFITAPQLAPEFGELLAVQLVELWHCLDRPVPFAVVEMGAGRGDLAQRILTYLQQQQPDLSLAIDYIIVDRSPALITEQAQQLQPFVQPDSGNGRTPSVRWCQWEDIPLASIVGCFISNELIDALPVHRVTVVQGQLQEIYVARRSLADPASLTPPLRPDPAQPYNLLFSAPPSLQPQLYASPDLADTIAPPSTPRLTQYLTDLGIDPSQLPEGYCTEVNLAALEWLETVAKRLDRGYVLTIDYGYKADRYYSPSRREGTLQCYYQHSHHNNPYLHLGQQDITTHVNFSALTQGGEAMGLHTVGYIEQALFLMALGLGDRLAALANQSATSSTAITTLLSRRDALQSLINPQGLGNFGVLLQSKGLTPAQQSHRLRGFTSPWV